MITNCLPKFSMFRAYDTYFVISTCIDYFRIIIFIIPNFICFSYKGI
nr:MAG TPA: hypothetical protein [Bacteriophage sp.]